MKKIMLLVMCLMCVGMVSALDLSDYPGMFIKDGKFDGVLVIGDRAPASDVIAVTDIATSLQYSSNRGSTSKIQVGNTLLASKVDLETYDLRTIMEEGETKNFLLHDYKYEVYVNIISDTTEQEVKFTINGENTGSLEIGEEYKLSDGTIVSVYGIIPNEEGDVTKDLVEFYLKRGGLQNMILVGRAIRYSSEGNSIIDRYYTSKPSGGLIKLVRDGNYYVLIVTGDSDSNVKAASRVLANYDDYDLDGTEYLIGSSSPKCTDSDSGKDYYEKGTCVDDIYGTKSDKCGGYINGVYNSQALGEHYCGDYQGNPVCLTTWKTDCPYGCEDGACRAEPEEIKCYSDSDCGSTETRHYCSGSAACTETKRYSCFNAGTTNSYCQQVSGGGSCGICPNGCEDGKCIQKKCTDSDSGKDYYEKGTVDIDPYRDGGEATDYCDSRTGQLVEYFCTSDGSNGGSSSLFYTCPNGCKDGACVKQVDYSECGESTAYDSRPRGSIKFGTISTWWSKGGKGSGWVYYKQKYDSGSEIYLGLADTKDIDEVDCSKVPLYSYGQDGRNAVLVSNGQILCMKQDGYYGALIPVEQTSDQYNPDYMKYRWVFNNDGRGTFDSCWDDDECVKEGEKGSRFDNDKCCAGLKQISNSFTANGGLCVAPTDGSFICSYCGNGVCGRGENSCNCPTDCNTQDNIYVNLDEKFELYEDQSAKVTDYGYMKITLQDWYCTGACAEGTACGVSCAVRLDVSMPAECEENEQGGSCAETGTSFTISEGESKEAFGAKITYLKKDGNQGVFIVQKPTSTEGVDVEIYPVENTINYGEIGRYKVTVSDKHIPTKCTSATKCLQTPYTYHIIVNNLPFWKDYPKQVMLGAGESTTFELVVKPYSLEAVEEDTAVEEKIIETEAVVSVTGNAAVNYNIVKTMEEEATEEKEVATSSASASSGGSGSSSTAVVESAALVSIRPYLRSYKFNVRAFEKNNPKNQDIVYAVLNVKPENIVVPPFPTEHVEIKLYKGWNLVTLPGKLISFEKIQLEKKLIGFVYIKEEQRYVTIKEAQNILGDEFTEYLARNAFWIYSYTDTKLVANVDMEISYNDISLASGWNLVPITEDMLGGYLDDVQGDCSFEKLYIWDPMNQSWRKITQDYLFPENYLNYGFLVGVDDSCRLGGVVISAPPAMPE